MQVPLQMTLLDFGLAEELTPSVRHHFISFLHAIAAGEPALESVYAERILRLTSGLHAGLNSLYSAGAGAAAAQTS